MVHLYRRTEVHVEVDKLFPANVRTLLATQTHKIPTTGFKHYRPPAPRDVEVVDTDSRKRAGSPAMIPFP